MFIYTHYMLIITCSRKFCEDDKTEYFNKGTGLRRGVTLDRVSEEVLPEGVMLGSGLNELS